MVDRPARLGTARSNPVGAEQGPVAQDLGAHPGEGEDTRGWRIGELGRRTGLTPKTIRYYEEAGLMPVPVRTTSGYRTYTEEAVTRLAFIRAAKNFGFTLGEIREILAVRDRDEAPCPYVLGVVREKLADLQERIHRLQLLSGDLEAIVRDAEATLPGEHARRGQYCHVIEHRRQRGSPAGAGECLDLPA